MEIGAGFRSLYGTEMRCGRKGSTGTLPVSRVIIGDREDSKELARNLSTTEGRRAYLVKDYPLLDEPGLPKTQNGFSEGRAPSSYPKQLTDLSPPVFAVGSRSFTPLPTVCVPIPLLHSLDRCSFVWLPEHIVESVHFHLAFREAVSACPLSS